jgi:hypothetical protein
MSELRQTAMQEAIEYLKSFNLEASAIILEDKFLEKEKEHIAKAWDAGYYGYFSLGIREIEFNNGEEYYKINYNETYTK